ncbi:araC family transcriptional regulator [Bordetella ansorpii]|uniref:AraC family transcriptional regulator n=1 Tax=Bordetella ansorpii TaxID=288768 RepID=A0A157MUI0_9BORD|nr:AraC family transcriptional regulator [Bordetella ansorpii]SAI12199.1 araC family transcriptional regulator [Bordetella ansorpii]
MSDSSRFNDVPDAPESASLAELPPAFDAGQERARLELVSLLRRLTGDQEGSVATAIEGLAINRVMNPRGPQHVIQRTALAIIAQGSKRLLVGDEVYEYDPMHYMVSSVDLPVVAKITAASSTEPYLGMRLEFSAEDIRDLLREGALPPVSQSGATRGLYVQRIGNTLLDAVLRLLRLLESPDDIRVLAPMIKREILYRLLSNGQGAQLRQIALHDSQTQRIADAIRLLRERYRQPLRVEDLAREVHMSVSSFHHHFKAVTAMSPLQYQKQLRLQEARRIMFMGGVDVSLAANLVGYESASQFSREYSRLFGASPMRDRRRLLEDAR